MGYIGTITVRSNSVGVVLCRPTSYEGIGDPWSAFMQLLWTSARFTSYLFIQVVHILIDS